MTSPKPIPPPEVSAALARDLAHFLPPERQIALRPITPSMAAAHEVYDVGIRDIQEGKLLAAARPTAWRFIFNQPGSGPAAAEVARSTEGPEPYGVTHVNEGPFVQSTIEAMKRLGPSSAVLRLLRVPAIYLYCLWQHKLGDERLMPLSPAPEGLQPYELYPQERVLEAAQHILSDRKERRTLMPDDDMAP